MDEKVVISCAKCKGEVFMYACPVHFWAISSECRKCDEVYIINSKCKECDFPFKEDI